MTRVLALLFFSTTSDDSSTRPVIFFTTSNVPNSRPIFSPTTIIDSSTRSMNFVHSEQSLKSSRTSKNGQRGAQRVRVPRVTLVHGRCLKAPKRTRVASHVANYVQAPWCVQTVVPSRSRIKNWSMCKASCARKKHTMQKNTNTASVPRSFRKHPTNWDASYRQ